MKGGIRFVILLLLAAVIFTSCATQTSLTQQWNDPTYKGTAPQKIFVLALTGEQRKIMIWEGACDQALTAVGVTPINASSVINFNPGNPLPDSMTVVGLVKNSGADLIMVSRLLNVNQVQTYVPGSTYYGGYGYYGYYAGGMGYMSTPGYYETDTQYELETNVFDVKTEKLVWSGASQTIDPSTGNDLAASVATTVVTNMVATGVIGPPAKKEKK